MYRTIISCKLYSNIEINIFIGYKLTNFEKCDFADLKKKSAEMCIIFEKNNITLYWHVIIKISIFFLSQIFN